MANPPDGPIYRPFGPDIGPVNPGIIRHVCRKSTADRASYPGKYGILPGFGLFERGLISVRSVVRVYPGPFSEVVAPLGLTGPGGVLRWAIPHRYCRFVLSV